MGTLRRGVGVVVAMALLASCGGGDDRARGPAQAGVRLRPLHAVRGSRPGVFDDRGRQVVLRGVNLNALGEYAVNTPGLDPNQPLRRDTWDRMAAEGFDVVRLLISWSKLEPRRGHVDERYVDEIRAAVRGAARRGIYTVVDMHQDAWGPYVATPDGVACPPGKEPSNGWDGAPRWATPPAGVDSCRGIGGSKPGSDLVVEAWNRFYDDTGGVQGRLVADWEALARSLAGEPSIAGYDLLNEPGYGSGPNASPGLLAPMEPLGRYYARAIAAIRRGEKAGGVAARPIFFEHAVNGNPPPVGFSDDPGLVFAPHLYGGSIVEALSVDVNWDVMRGLADQWHTSLWAGEYGWWDDPASRPELVGRVEAFARQEDGKPGAAWVPVGSAWWQWNNGCGDPHQITSRGRPAPPEIRQYRVTRCVDGRPRDAGVVPAWHRILSRPAVRFAPGWIAELESDGAAGTLSLRGVDARAGAELELWVPGRERPTVTGSGISRVRSRRVASGGGWRVTARVCSASYEVSVGAESSSGPQNFPSRIC